VSTVGAQKNFLFSHHFKMSYLLGLELLTLGALSTIGIRAKIASLQPIADLKTQQDRYELN
jgi:hypothetical protein